MTEKKIAIVKNEAIGKIAYEMGLHKWLILSKHAEEKKIRTNLKKLGCLFESFLGALFLDFNKITVKDEEGWFKNIFVTGPGFQMAQKFVENIFEKHIDWIALIQNIIFLYYIWQCRLARRLPNFLTIENNMLTIFDNVLTLSKHLSGIAEKSDFFICRAWRLRQGRG